MVRQQLRTLSDYLPATKVHQATQDQATVRLLLPVIGDEVCKQEPGPDTVDIVCWGETVQGDISAAIPLPGIVSFLAVY